MNCDGLSITGEELREARDILSHQFNWDGSKKILVEPIDCKDFLKKKV